MAGLIPANYIDRGVPKVSQKFDDLETAQSGRNSLHGMRRRAYAISPKFERWADIVRRSNKPGAGEFKKITGMANDTRRYFAGSRRSGGNRVDCRRAATLSAQAGVNGSMDFRDQRLGTIL
jgi:hypothetical protein